MVFPTEVVVHPLVLLSVTDHYNRVAKDSKRRVVGVLLGETDTRRKSPDDPESEVTCRVDVTNSFAVPFGDDPRDPSVWFLDVDYLETLYGMVRKVNAREKIVGFYSSGPRLRAGDLAIEELFRKYTSNPVLVIVDVRPEIDDIPTQAYATVEMVVEGKETKRTFAHVPSEVGAYEAEEIGVEHLLRDINDPSVSSLAEEMRNKLSGLRGLTDRLRQMATYLTNVTEGRLPPNHAILHNMQTIVNLLPNLSVESLVKSMFVSTNDMHLVIYISSMIRSVIALHDLVTNKIKYKHDEEERERAGTAAESKAEDDGKDGKESKAESGPGAGASAGSS